MGGVGSGGHKNSPGDVETHSAWDLIDPISGTPQKLRQARCKHCNREMAQHTSRQRAHLLKCQAYLDAMKAQGSENSITRQAADPDAFAKQRKADQTDGVEKRKNAQKLVDFPIALRIQALALAEANISHDRILEITGIETNLVSKMLKLARERGYDSTTSMHMKEEYVANPVDKRRGRAKKYGIDGVVRNGVSPTTPGRAVAGFVRAETNSLPPGDWNFMTPTQAHSDSSTT